jgi:hypothetical protein
MVPRSLERRSPYKGLIPYGEDDAPFFFGREKETRLCIANLFASPLTLLYGASGVGKSSMLRAGVANQLRQREDLLVAVFNTWQGDPVQDLKAAIVKETARIGAKNVPPAQLTLAEFLSSCSSGTGRRLMLILDQFEEYFLYHPQEDIFAEEFSKAVIQEEVPISFLISIREDTLAKLDRFEGRIPRLFDNYLRIDHLSREAARTAIEKPIELYNQCSPEEPPVSIEPALVEAILGQVATGQVTLGEAGRGAIKTDLAQAEIETPYLQLVLTRLWEEEMQAKSRVLRLETLTALGGAERIVRTHLDQTMDALPQEKQHIAARVFHHLVTPSGSKIAHTVPDLAEYADMSPTELAPVLEELASGEKRVLRGVAPPSDQPNRPRYEIFHDVLAPAILDWRRRYMQIQERIKTERTAKAEQERAEEQALIARRFQRLTWALIGLCGLLILLAIYGYRQQRRAIAASRTAEEQAKKFKETADTLTKTLEAKAAGERALTESTERRDADNLFKDGVSKVDSDPKAAREDFKQALEKYRNMKNKDKDVERDELNTLMYLGRANQNDHQYYAASENFNEVLKRRKDNSVQHDLGILYFAWGEYISNHGKDAKWQYTRACDILTRIGDTNIAACEKLKPKTEQQPPKEQ